jgi:hypothetical protein
MTLISEVEQSNRDLEHFGWCSPEKARAIIDLMTTHKPRLSVELGVFGGRSLMPMALFCKHNGGHVIGVDPWSNTVATEGYDGPNADFWDTVDMEKVYQKCLITIARYGCDNYVTLHRATSDEAPLYRDIGLLHIDGQHAEPAIRDVKRWAPGVVAGGVLIMDDCTWFNGDRCHVAEAAALLPSMGFVELRKLDTGAVFERKEIL